MHHVSRGEDVQKVRTWLATAASVSGFIGFAVGRTTFWDALVEWRAGRITREAAVNVISERYREWVDIFEDGMRKAANRNSSFAGRSIAGRTRVVIYSCPLVQW